MSAITLLTDFGTQDPYVGMMKGVILSIDPDAGIIDICHEVAPQDVREAAFMLQDYWRYFPAGTIHLVIIDPTVGSSRRPILVEAAGHYFIGPDNGVFTSVINPDSRVRVLENRKYMLTPISSTFHGRDIFSPAAAWISKGINPETLGSQITGPIMLHGMFPAIAGNEMTGFIVRFDHFGNAITNISASMFHSFAGDSPFQITIGDTSFTSFAASYYENKYTCLVGSSGYIEFGVFGGNFRKERSVNRGDPVLVRIP